MKCADCGREMSELDVLSECFNDAGDAICVACEYHLGQDSLYVAKHIDNWGIGR